MSAALAEARRLAAEFRATAAARDLAGGSPTAERNRLRASGLLKLSIPSQHGGHGAAWPEILHVVRELATADASLAHIFAYHHLGVITPHLIGTPAQRDHWYARTVNQQLFWGNSLNPLDPRTTLTRGDEGTLRLNGEKSFCTGSKDSDVLLVSATEMGEPQLRVAVIPTSRQGVLVNDDWDNMGQRQTDSGSVSYRDVVVYPAELLGPPGPGGSAFATLRTCITQASLSNIYLGLAQGAFEEARQYTRALERPFYGSPATHPTDDPYILQRYGEMHVQIAAAGALLDTTATALQQAWERDTALTADERGTCAAVIATAKVAAARCALDLTSQIFEVMGARATSGRYRFDRFWRNARTLTLHDPPDVKTREVGDWVLNGRFPNATFYS
jgi:alkylation response protein AidB-like acyl-CoA dehydrogenase